MQKARSLRMFDLLSISIQKKKDFLVIKLLKIKVIEIGRYKDIYGSVDP